MSTVTISIGPKNYPVACADGEEAHIAALGAMIAEKYALIGSARAPLEAQNLLFAALFLADELAEARKRAPGSSKSGDKAPALRAEIARLEGEIAELRKAPAEPPAPQPEVSGNTEASVALAERLESLAERAEASAAALEAIA